MKTLEYYIRKDDNFRQKLQKMEGGIMKYWAEHPDSDFDSTLFTNYQKQIVDFYLQANKRNRDVVSLSDHELIVKARNWYRFTEKELHFYITLQPFIAKMPKEVKEQASQYIEDYLSYTYKDYRHHYYPDGITPVEFYNEVVSQYGPGGLARDCMDFILREHHNPQVWLKKKSEYFLLREFFVQQYSEVLEEERGYRKLRQAVKEMTEGKSQKECRQMAFNTMMSVKYFSRMLYATSEVKITDCTGSYKADKEWLRKVAREGILHSNKIPFLHSCFSYFVLVLNEIGRIWAARLLVCGINMHELEKETGCILFPVSEPAQWPDGLDHGKYRYYIDKDISTLDGNCCIYNEEQAKELLSKVMKPDVLSPKLSDKEKLHRLEVTNTVIKTHNKKGNLVVNLLELHRFLALHFAGNVQHKYEWYALRRFLLKYDLINEGVNNVEFEKQMNLPDWFGYLEDKKHCSQSEMNNYNFLNDLEPCEWRTMWNKKNFSPKARQEGVDLIYRTFCHLDNYFPLFNEKIAQV